MLGILSAGAVGFLGLWLLYGLMRGIVRLFGTPKQIEELRGPSYREKEDGKK